MKQNVTLILVLVLAAVSAGAQDRDRCPEFSQLADRALSSSVGNADYTARLLKPEVGRQLGSAFDLEALQDAVKDQLRGEPDCCEAKGDRYVTSEREFRGEQDSRLRVDLERGKIVYLNRGRSHDVLSGPRFEIAADQAAELATATLGSLGLPLVEVDREFLEVRELMAAGRGSDGEGERVNELAELHVRAPRRISGIPVFDSFSMAAIDARGRIARLHVQWPDFALVRGLSPRSALKRSEVLVSLVERLAETHECKTLSRLIAEVAYVPVDQLTVAAQAEDDGDAENRSDGAKATFAPALVVYAIPTEPKEDSGEISMGAQQFVIPLFRGNPEMG